MTPEIDSSREPSDDAPESRPLVLLVDDRAETLATIESALAPLEVRVLRAVSPQAAVDAVATHQFAVALVDAQIPGMASRELARRLNGAGAGRLTPIVFIAAVGADRRREPSDYETGTVDYLFSPLDPAEIRAKVGAFVRLQREHESETNRERRRFADLSGAAAALAAERRAAMILESITDAFYALDSEYRFTYVNRRAEQLWGRRRAELIGQNAWAAFPTMAGTESERRHIQAMTTREPVHFELESPLLHRWIEVNLYPEPAGGLSCYIQDVTTRKEAEAERERLVGQLRAERARLSAILRDAPAFLAVLRGRDFVFEFANEAYYELVGHRELIGRPALDAVPETRGQGFGEILVRVLDTGQPFVGREVPVSLERRRGAGLERRYLDFTYFPLEESDGARPGIVAYGLDVTDHVMARRDVERARDRMTTLQTVTAALAGATSPDAVADVAVAQGVAKMGAATAMLILRDLDDPTRALLLRAHGLPDDLSARTSTIAALPNSPASATLRTGAPCFIETREGLHERFPEVSDIWKRLGTQAIATLPMNVSGQTLGAMSFTFSEPRQFDAEDREFFLDFARQAALGLERARLIHALTRERETAVRARTEAELARAEWEQAASVRSQFLATMSHELRTPINAQIGYTQLLQMGIAGPLTPGQRDYLERLGRNSEHLLALINDVLDLSKIEARQLSPSRDDLMTGTVVDAALDVARPLAGARGVRLDDHRPDPAGVPYVGDEQRVRQVLVNLLSNAIKFTEPGGSIIISCETKQEAPGSAMLHGRGPWASVSVEDTGIGIDAAQLARIFEPFHQVDSGHTRTQGGTGLGLAISRRLARLMGGDLTVESTVGRGSTFTLWLPAADPADVGVGTAAETAADRRARADRVEPRIEATGAERIGAALRGSLDEVIEAYLAQLRTDPLTPGARVMTTPEVEDHAPSLLADVAQAMFIIARGGPEANELLRDGSAIQRTIAEHHGRRRYAQHFDEAALVRDSAILREELTRVVSARLKLTPRDVERGAQSLDDGLEVMLGLLDRAAAVSLRAWRSAAQT